MLEVGEVDGRGQYGVLEEDADGLLCHECGDRFTHLGLHAWRTHGMTADTYRKEHGLGRRGLVAASTRIKQAENARLSLGSKDRFLSRRDPARAKAVQAERATGISPAGKLAIADALAERNRRRAIERRARLAVVIVCEGCGAAFCPLHDKRRRFCSMSCSGRANSSRRRDDAQSRP